MSEERVAKIRQALEASFAPLELLIKDQSHLHAGHEGAKDGRGHFDVRIVSKAFEGRGRVARHQAVYQALGDLLQSDIHAVRINALTPEDVRDSGNQTQN